ncbi:MAG: NADH:ubiquinone reductase (Na(+)-transporting) subunit C [Rikenellaceae bacterium]|nr:NADH:ubiquinone reductase (Na(+)-transporting) subunit C [Rikenellaceae bacterium]
MNKNSNKYIITYASVMVIIVAAVLSFAALQLKDRQDNNVRMEKMGDLLRSIGKGEDANSVKDKFAYITEEYDKYIQKAYTVTTDGNISDGDAFEILLNLKSEYDKSAAERNLPVFESNDNGKKYYVLPTWGSGLWGPVWGYVALEEDWSTIYGIILDHASETPGLGAEITSSAFQDQFKGKQIYSGDKFVGITVLKNGAENNPHAVDAISGGTITSRAVETMIANCIKNYGEYIAKQRQAEVAVVSVSEVESEQVNTTDDE